MTTQHDVERCEECGVLFGRDLLTYCDYYSCSALVCEECDRELRDEGRIARMNDADDIARGLWGEL